MTTTDQRATLKDTLTNRDTGRPADGPPADGPPRQIEGCGLSRRTGGGQETKQRITATDALVVANVVPVAVAANVLVAAVVGFLSSYHWSQ